jgi:hypothetical protein
MKLRIENPGEPPREITWSGETELVLGRNPHADVPIANAHLGGRHCTLSLERAHDAGADPVILVRDLGSHNGVHVGGERVNHARLALGDAFTIGSATVHLLRDDETPSNVAADAARAPCPFPAYPGAVRFDDGRVYGANGAHITWQAWASYDAPSSVVAFYESRSATDAAREGIVRWRWQGHVLEIALPPGGPPPYARAKLPNGATCVIFESVLVTRGA